MAHLTQVKAKAADALVPDLSNRVTVEQDDEFPHLLHLTVDTSAPKQYSTGKGGGGMLVANLPGSGGIFAKAEFPFEGVAGNRIGVRVWVDLPAEARKAASGK